ncbi:hypothetical protein Lepto7376_3151 [[Leptolyngbya] sp. PCC 7376]|uniref:DUF4334 domain-containing protein n=1 Tax=[Leptolyngbya] sp. PCC 7376 TaxID=111781 RepID=UPI00029EFF69|nr:DUF4334 domain-containing protein [[Leptolyngbya] sp. PCC 7376]AFY39385.1 hypothetical protein Lepto7376_3151 [[Leptolyngbya] sp. PCC 7376]
MAIAPPDTQIIDAGKATTTEALALFDSLEPVDLEFMWGRWHGRGIETEHPMDGMLEMSNWYGKEFIDAETVHPLLFADRRGEIFKVAPHPMAMDMVLKFPMPNNPSLKPLLIALNSLFKTDKSQARLRMMENRGQVTATMIYDYLPINDSFRKLDENRVFGIMDYKKIEQPFFFVLTRDLL